MKLFRYIKQIHSGDCKEKIEGYENEMKLLRMRVQNIWRELELKEEHLKSSWAISDRLHKKIKELEDEIKRPTHHDSQSYTRHKASNKDILNKVSSFIHDDNKNDANKKKLGRPKKAE